MMTKLLIILSAVGLSLFVVGPTMAAPLRGHHQQEQQQPQLHEEEHRHRNEKEEAFNPAFWDADDCPTPPALSFQTLASGAQEVPTAVTTTTTASLDVTFATDLSRIDYDLKVFNGVKITQAHLHCAKAGINGPIILILAGASIPLAGPGGVDVNGDLSQGSATTVTSVTCPGSSYAVNNIASLLQALLTNEIYLNVHSEANPTGVVRGQFFNLD